MPTRSRGPSVARVASGWSRRTAQTIAVSNSTSTDTLVSSVGVWTTPRSTRPAAAMSTTSRVSVVACIQTRTPGRSARSLATASAITPAVSVGVPATVSRPDSGVPQIVRIPLDPIDGAEDLLDLAMQPPRLDRRLQTPFHTGEQLEAQPPFELMHRIGRGGLRHLQPHRSFGHGSPNHDLPEDFELPQLQHAVSAIPTPYGTARHPRRKLACTPTNRSMPATSCRTGLLKLAPRCDPASNPLFLPSRTRRVLRPTVSLSTAIQPSIRDTVRVGPYTLHSRRPAANSGAPGVVF